QDERSAGGQEGGTEGEEPPRPLVDPPRHRRPQVVPRLRLLYRRQRRLDQLLESIFVHGSIPILSSFRRRIRTARNTRDFTPPIEIPSAAAISSYFRSSTSASVAATLSLGRSSRNARRTFCNVSPLATGSGTAAATGSTRSGISSV